MSPSTKRSRRSPEELVAELQAKITKIKARAEQAKAKRDPSLRHISGAVRSIDKAMGEPDDKATRAALAEARATLAACLTLGEAKNGGTATLVPRQRREKPDSERVLAYIAKHPGSSSEDICAELGTDAVSLRNVLHDLRDQGRVKVEGKARATRYSAAKG
jgi:hypothetical protein